MYITRWQRSSPGMSSLLKKKNGILCLHRFFLPHIYFWENLKQWSMTNMQNRKILLQMQFTTKHLWNMKWTNFLWNAMLDFLCAFDQSAPELLAPFMKIGKKVLHKCIVNSLILHYKIWIIWVKSNIISRAGVVWLKCLWSKHLTPRLLNLALQNMNDIRKN